MADLIDLTGDSDEDAPWRRHLLDADTVIDLCGTDDDDELLPFDEGVACDSDDVVYVGETRAPPPPRAPQPHAAQRHGAAPRFAPHPPMPRLRGVKRKRAGPAVVNAAAEAASFHALVTSVALFRPRPARRALALVAERFTSVAAYRAAFEAPLVEEAREAVRHGWSSACAAAATGRGAQPHVVRVSGVTPANATSGWFCATVEAADERTPLPMLQDGAVAVFSSVKPGRSPLDELRSAEVSATSARVAGNTRQQPPLHFAAFIDCDRDGGAAPAGKRAPPRLRFYVPPPDAEPAEGDEGGALPPLFHAADVLARLRDGDSAASSSGGNVWHLVCVGRLASAPAEFRALQRVAGLHQATLTTLLDPMPLLPLPPYMQLCRSAPDYATQAPPPLPPALGSAFASTLARDFNEEQRAAIGWALAAGEAAATADEALASGVSPAHPYPFTLVQGPPGTGKSHTIWGMLNALQAAGLCRQAAQLDRKLSRHPADDSAAAHGGLFEIDMRRYGGGGDGEDPAAAQLLATITDAAPRILVCAPSNAAVDVLVSRMLARPGCDAAGAPCVPVVARLASEGADTSALVARVDCGKQIEALAAQPSPARTTRERELTAQLKTLAADVSRLRVRSADPGRVAALASACMRYRRASAERHRLRLLAKGPLRSQREAIEMSLLADADVVFTTLGSAGRAIFSRLGRGFDIAIIDEAAQATESAALVALHHAAAAAVLVGDPAQLPATVLSAAAKGAAYERSLFERLVACGVPSLMLTRQFRMHAAIVAFPSAYFYQGRLRTDASVAARPAAAFQLPAAAPLAPFVFFDVADGSERFQPGATSALNSAEAELAAALYRRLAQLEAGPGGDVADAMRRLAPRVGFVTPYKGQADELRRVLRERLGGAVADALLAAKAVNTVDGFQGAERDVIILSLVRTRGGALGHVDDVRRMNVGLTRAQRALWVLGNRRALQASPHWARLVEHARVTGALVRHPGLQSLGGVTKQETQHGRSGR